ncbi:hypothetical protein L7F22_045014 [Adiantum nelumboides]|nr:hypothetical protein [Adiantum nelumboides]
MTHNIKALDLYNLFISFETYVVLCEIASGLLGKFCPEALNIQFTKGILGWLVNIILIKLSLFSPGNVDATILDIVSYAWCFGLIDGRHVVAFILLWHHAFNQSFYGYILGQDHEACCLCSSKEL